MIVDDLGCSHVEFSFWIIFDQQSLLAGTKRSGRVRTDRRCGPVENRQMSTVAKRLRCLILEVLVLVLVRLNSSRRFHMYRRWCWYVLSVVRRFFSFSLFGGVRQTKVFGKESKSNAPTGQSANTSPAVTPFVNTHYRKHLSGREESDQFASRLVFRQPKMFTSDSRKASRRVGVKPKEDGMALHPA